MTPNVFIAMIASFKKYGDELKPGQGVDFAEDAIETMNDLIDQARDIIARGVEKTA